MSRDLGIDFSDFDEEALATANAHDPSDVGLTRLSGGVAGSSRYATLISRQRA
jgi:hypothetical protein